MNVSKHSQTEIKMRVDREGKQVEYSGDPPNAVYVMSKALFVLAEKVLADLKWIFPMGPSRLELQHNTVLTS